MEHRNPPHVKYELFQTINHSHSNWDYFAFLSAFAFRKESRAFAFECERPMERKARLSFPNAERQMKAKAGLSFKVHSAFRIKAERRSPFEGVARATPSEVASPGVRTAAFV